MNAWLRCLAVVDFDVEEGQRVLERTVVPQSARWIKDQERDEHDDVGDHDARVYWPRLVTLAFPDTALDGRSGFGLDQSSGGGTASSSSGSASGSGSNVISPDILSFRSFDANSREEMRRRRAASSSSSLARRFRWLSRDSADSNSSPSNSNDNNTDSDDSSSHDDALDQTPASRPARAQSQPVNRKRYASASASPAISLSASAASDSMPLHSSGATVIGGGAPVSLEFNPSGRHISTVYVFRQNVAPPAEPEEKLYGFVYFRQQPDTRIKRGYAQQSVVLLTAFPFIALFAKVVEQIGRLWWNGEGMALECAYQEIRNWPDLRGCKPGTLIPIPLLGNIARFRVPDLDLRLEFGAFQQDSTGRPLAETAQGARLRWRLATSFASSTVPGMHGDKLTTEDGREWEALSLWRYLYGPGGTDVAIKTAESIWEIVMSGEPLVVIAGNPADCSCAVLAFVQTIAPLQYQGDVRPFVTMDDEDFDSFATADVTPSHVMIGATNPFFEKALEHWPHVVKLTTKGDRFVATFRSTRKNSEIVPLSMSRRVARAIRACSTPKEKNERLLAHLRDLTKRFVSPVVAYNRSLSPPESQLRWPSLDIWRGPPEMPSLNYGALMKRWLEAKVFDSSAKASLSDLFARFLETRTFAFWFAEWTDLETMRVRDAFTGAILASAVGIEADAVTRDPNDIERLAQQVISLAAELDAELALAGTRAAEVCSAAQDMIDQSLELHEVVRRLTSALLG